MELTKSLRLNSQTETESSSLTYFEEKKNSRRSTVCMHLLMRQNKGKIKLSNNACPDWLIVYLESWPKGFGTPPLFHVYFYGIYS